VMDSQELPELTESSETPELSEPLVMLGEMVLPDVTVWLDVPVPEELLESEESLETQELPEPPELLVLMEMLEETTLDVLDTPELLEPQD